MHTSPSSRWIARSAGALAAVTLVTAIGASAAVAGPATGSAGASSTAVTRPERTTTAVSVDLTSAKAACDADVDLRVAKLAALTASLDAATSVTDPHRSAQKASLADASSGLTVLKARIDADTDAKTLKSDCQSVATGYRVFALRAPQTGLIIAGDAQAAAVERMNATVPTLTDAIAKLEAAGKDVAAAKVALTDLQAKLADAGPKAAGVADGVIGFTAADHNTNKQVLEPAHTTVLAVRADLVAARTDLKTIASSIKALVTK